MDDVDVQLVRLCLWSLFAAARSAAANDGGTFPASECAQHADAMLEDAETRFPFLKPPPVDPLDLV